MYQDSLGLFSESQALTGTAVSTNVIDLSSDRNVGIGEPLSVVIDVIVAAGGTSPTFKFDVQSGSTSTPTTVIASQTPAAASLTAGARVVLPLPADLSGDRYLRLNYTLGGTSPTITVTADLKPTCMVQAETTYPSSVTIS